MKKISEEGKVSFSQSVKDFYAGYFDFSGRSTRAGYWWLTLAIIISYVVLIILTAVVSGGREYYESAVSPAMIFIIVIFTLSLIVPSLALSVRRLRDVGLQSKTILSIYVLYYALYGTVMMSFYSSMFNSLSTMASAYSNYSDSYMPTASMNFSGSPMFTFLFGLVSFFLTISMFLPTDMLATKSNNAVLTSIFSKKV
jgi:uncharacterized membrane protein YhaH (DUF805 family)